MAYWPTRNQSRTRELASTVGSTAIGRSVVVVAKVAEARCVPSTRNLTVVPEDRRTSYVCGPSVQVPVMAIVWTVVPAALTTADSEPFAATTKAARMPVRPSLRAKPIDWPAFRLAFATRLAVVRPVVLATCAPLRVAVPPATVAVPPVASTVRGSPAGRLVPLSS